MYARYFINLISLILVGSTVAVRSPKGVHPDTGLSIIELVTKYGYPIESHQVQTDDGYILTMHRIPGGRKIQNASKKAAVLLMHGLLSSSFDWVNMGPNKALGFLLAEAGFDVWMGNHRGNTWSRKHTHLDPDTQSAKFFDFSFHEIGYYDLPAKINYILNTTGQNQVSYVGHSQGTTSFFVMAAERPEYNQKIRLMSALAPVAYMSNLYSPLVRLLQQNMGLIQLLERILNIHEFLPHYDIITELGATLCAEGSNYQELCATLLFMLGGFDSPQMDRNFISVITTGCPAGASMKQLYHYFQEVNSRNFCQYDYGAVGNKIKYGQSEPPKYDISNISAPIALYYSDNDWMASSTDVERLIKQLPNVKVARKIPYKDFTHLDYMWATDIVDLLNDDVVTELLDAL